jgi:hypothetical protein
MKCYTAYWQHNNKQQSCYSKQPMTSSNNSSILYWDACDQQLDSQLWQQQQ